MGVSEDNREVGADCSSYRLNHLHRKSGSTNHVSTILVRALVSEAPEELVNEVTVRTVNLYRIKANALRVGCGLGIRLHDVLNLLNRQRLG
ncbi:hypothetical protein D3C75_1111450 [compost metagenome]